MRFWRFIWSKLTRKPKGGKWTGSTDEVIGYAQMCSSVYNADSTIKNKYKGAFVKEVPEYDVKYFVFTNNEKKTQYVAIRGTANIENIKADVHYTKDKDPKLKIYLHSGFARASQEVYADLKQRILPGYKVCITGHSLGGAIAVICAMYFKKDKVKVNRVVTFGQPKVTNHKGVWKYKRMPLLRVVNDEDPVPLLPPISLVTLAHDIYRHFGPELLLKPKGEDPIYYNRHEAQRLGTQSLWGQLSDGGIEVDDHYIKAYLKELRKIK